MPPREEWRRYVAPAVFLLAVTIAVIVIRSGLESGSATHASSPLVPTTTHRVGTTTASTTSRRTTTASSSAKRFWTVKAGDTFGVISSHTGVPVSTIEHLNPNASSTSLFIGEKIRVR
jgi:LysM repeat protein